MSGVGRLAGMVTAPITRAAHWLAALWRRSLQLRIVTITLVGSATVIAIVGMLLMNQISNGLVRAHREAALRETSTGQDYAEQQLGTLSGADDPQLDGTLRAVVANLSDRGGRAGRFAVAATTDNLRLPPLYVAQYDPETIDVPKRLAGLVTGDHVLGYQYVSTSIGTVDSGGESKPFLVVGTPVDSPAGPFALYYFFPLDEQVDAVDLVRKSLIGMGSLLVVLLAGIAWLLTRQVVTPVRLAARTAERLSAGLLEERMAVKGEDDIARLAHSFNQMAANLQRQIVALEQLSRMQRRFTSDVSHELRTPLTTIRMAADVLHAERQDFDPVSARSIELLSAEVDRFEALLSDLLEVSRYDSGAAVLDAEPTDVGALITKVVSALEPLAARNHVQLRPVLPDPRVIAEVDPRRIERILRNLVGNAIEYGCGTAEETKPVRIVLAADAHAFCVTVRDYGHGFREVDAESVFSRFWRADLSRARHTGGTGLGLSIAREDARLHDGELQAWGMPDAGAQFRLWVPLHAGDTLAGQEPALPLEPNDAEASS